jgi:hypothetical protein
MTFKETTNDTQILTGKYEVRGATTTDGGSTFYYSWEVSFSNETLQDFIKATGIETLGITGLRYIEPSE